MTIPHFKHITEQALPAQARAHRWPIRLDHCFKRVCLDHAFQGVWHHHIPRPAERHLTGEPLARAEQILGQGPSLLSERKMACLRYAVISPKRRFPSGMTGKKGNGNGEKRICFENERQEKRLQRLNHAHG